MRQLSLILLMVASLAAQLLVQGWMLGTAQSQEPAAADSDSSEIVESANQESASGLQQVGAVFRQALSKVESSLVVIESFGGATVSSGRIGGLKAQGEGSTTGVVVSSDGLIVTSTFNFVGQPPVVTVITGDGERHVARMVAQDLTRNLCLLKIQRAEGFVVPEFVAKDQVRVGQWVAAVGTGYGDRVPAISIGVVSALDRASGRAIQTDANTSPANYGGPLIDLEGRIVGICVPLNPTAPGPAAGVEWYDSGIGFAIAIETESQWWQRLSQGEKLEFGFLGVELGPADAEGVPPGASIVSVVEGGPAAEAGAMAGDVFKTIGGRDVIDPAQFGVELRRYLSGDQVAFEVVRGTETLTIEVTLGKAIGQTPEIAPIQAQETPIEPSEPGEPSEPNESGEPDQE